MMKTITENPRIGASRIVSLLQSSIRWLGILAGILGVSFLLLVFAGYFHTKVKQRGAASANKGNPNAVVFEIKLTTQTRFESAIGAIRPVHQSDVASKILARVLEVNVTAGKQVQAGDLLIRLTDDEQVARVRQAEADRDAAQAQLQLAKSESARATQLVQSRSISQADFDSAQATLQTAIATLERANRTLEEAKVFLDFANIVAPFNGIVVDRTVERGDTVTPGQKLLTMYDPSKMQLVANVRESLASKLRVGEPIRASMETLGYECVATISEIVPKSDIGSRSFEVKVTGPCPAGVYSGMFGRIHIPLADEQLILIPSNAVQRVGQLTMVSVLENDQSMRRSVQLGRTFDNQIEVLSGLAPGERILVSR